MAITFFGRTATPTDSGSNAGPTVTFTPPASMLADDFVLVFLQYKTTSTTLTFSETAADGQTWTSETKQATATIMSQWFKCKFNGTWLLNPIFTISSAGSSPMGGVMLVFRGVDTTTQIDNADTNAAYAAPGTPFDVTLTGIDPTTDNAMVVAAWSSVDDNTWALQTGGWTNPSGEAQWRNLQGTDMSISAAYMVVATGSSGNVTNRQTALGGDDGATHIIALRPLAGAISITAGVAAATGAGIGATVDLAVPSSTGAGTAAAAGASSLLNVTTATGVATGAGVGAATLLGITSGSGTATATGSGSTIGFSAASAAAIGAGIGATVTEAIPGGVAGATGGGVGATIAEAVGSGTAAGTAAASGASDTLTVGSATATATGAGTGASELVNVTAAAAATTAAGIGATVTVGSNVAVSADTAVATGAGFGATIQEAIPGGAGAATAAASGATATIAVGAGTASGTGAASGAMVTLGGNIAITAGTAIATAAGIGADLLNTTPTTPTSVVFVGGGGWATPAPRIESRLPWMRYSDPIEIEAGTARADAYAHGPSLRGNIDADMLRRILVEDEELILVGAL